MLYTGSKFRVEGLGCWYAATQLCVEDVFSWGVCMVTEVQQDAKVF